MLIHFKKFLKYRLLFLGIRFFNLYFFSRYLNIVQKLPEIKRYLVRYCVNLLISKDEEAQKRDIWQMTTYIYMHFILLLAHFRP